MKKLIIIIFSVLLFSTIAFSQKAKKLGQIGFLACNQFNAEMRSVYAQNKTDFMKSASKIAIFYYAGAEGTKYEIDPNRIDYRTNLPPIPGEARNRASEIIWFLVNELDMPKHRIELFDGGFRDEFAAEIWLVPRDSSLPMPTPTIDTSYPKHIKIKPNSSRTCSKPQLFDEFGNIQCGDFMARMAALYSHFSNLREVRIYVVYYGGLATSNLKSKQIINRKLVSNTHRNDGLNRALSIPQYFIDMRSLSSYGGRVGKRLLRNIFLINGGYLESPMTRIWLVPNGSKPPKPKSGIKETDILFKSDKPKPVRRQAYCYSSH